MDRLKEFRVSRNLTQKAMADKMGITLSMYEKVERGAVSASAGFMRRMVAVFSNVDIGYIFFEENSNKIAHHEKEVN